VKLTINVTARDIEYGKRLSCQSCPIARACRRLKYFQNCAVSNLRIYFNRVVTTDNSIELPREASEFIEKFDRGKKVKPFKFEIEVPDGKE